MNYAELKFSPEHIAKALRKERVGGVSWISICGAGETLAQKEIVDIVYYILKEGHYVNITTNGTLTNQIKQILGKCNDYLVRLHFSFSFHYTELVRLNLIDVFFSNLTLVKESGASFLYQINLCDEYVPYIEEIKALSLERVGSLPQVALTRNESSRPFSIWTSMTDQEYYDLGHSFDSELFEFTYKNFNVKRTEFCYAGDWSFVLNLQTGWLTQCYANCEGQNIFDDLNSPIKLTAVGKRCNNLYCVNSSHFMSLGVIPEIQTPSYAALRCRENSDWYSKEMYEFLNSKLFETNKQYGFIKRWKISGNQEIYRSVRRKLYSLKKKIIG